MTTRNKLEEAVHEVNQILLGTVREYGPSYEISMQQSFSISGKSLLRVASILFGHEWEILGFEDHVVLHVDKDVYDRVTGEVCTKEFTIPG